MPAFVLPRRLASVKKNNTSKAKKQAKPISSPDDDQDSVVFDPREFNPFDQPDMSVETNGRPARSSQLDPYAVVESPRQTLTQYLHSRVSRSKTVGPSKADGYPLVRVSGSTFHPQSEPQPRSFEKVSGYHVQRPGSTFIGPSHWVNPDYQTPDGHFNTGDGHQQHSQMRESANRPTSWPPRRYTAGATPRRRGISQCDARRLSPLSEQSSSTVPVSHQKILSPRFKNPMPTVFEARENQAWVTAAQILEPQKGGPTPISLNQCLETQLKRRVSNRSPDSGISGVGEEVKEEDKTDEVDPVLDQPSKGAQQSATRRPRSSSTPSKRSSVWLDSWERQERDFPRTKSLNRARFRTKTSSSTEHIQRDARERREELRAQRRFKAILQRQDAMKEVVAEGHLQKIMNAARRLDNLEVWDKTIGDLTGKKSILNVRLERVKLVRELKFVSDVKWSPIEGTFMTSGLSATIENADAEKDRVRSRIRKWMKRRKAPKFKDCIFQCPIGQWSPERCQERRLNRMPGAIPGTIC